MLRTFRAPTSFPEHAFKAMQIGKDAGVGLKKLKVGAPYDGRTVNLDNGLELLNFGCCSYLGLDQRQELKDACIAATERYGTQFSISRAYLENGLYGELNEALQAITGGHVLVTSSVSQGHNGAMPVLMRPGDGIIIDQFAHSSLQTAVGALDKDIKVERVRHNDIARLDAYIKRMSETCNAVWYVFDGLYSMFGDFAPMEQIGALLEKHPKLHLYCDDAHSTTWHGKQGRGHALDLLSDTSRVVVALSLNKAFACAGGALVFSNEEMRDKVRVMGGPFNFSGPIQPPQLGAAVACARYHMTPEFAEDQAVLRHRILTLQTCAAEAGLQLAAPDATPIFFLPLGGVAPMIAATKGMEARGFLVCPAGYPAVPEKDSGVRFTVTTRLSDADIEGFVDALAAEAANALKYQDIDIAKLMTVWEKGAKLAPGKELELLSI